MVAVTAQTTVGQPDGVIAVVPAHHRFQTSKLNPIGLLRVAVRPVVIERKSNRPNSRPIPFSRTRATRYLPRSPTGGFTVCVIRCGPRPPRFQTGKVNPNGPPPVRVRLVDH